MARERRLFSEEFKREAVKLIGQPGASKAGIAHDLGVGANLLGRWRREADVDGQLGGWQCRIIPTKALNTSARTYNVCLSPTALYAV